MPTLRQYARNNPTIARMLFRFQVFLIRRNWGGKLGDAAMVITTTGRKSGRRRSTPIGYLRDGDSVLAFSYPHHHWYQNVRCKPEAVITIKGRKIPVRVELVDDEAGRQRVIEAYQRERPGSFPRMFRLAADAPLDEVIRAAKVRVFVRFWPGTPPS